MSKKIEPQDFTLSLALVDAAPVVLFSVSCLMIYRFFPSKLYLLGAVVCALSGLGKVLWKLLLVTVKRNVWFLFMQMRVAMPAGFLLMLSSLVVRRDLVQPQAVLRALSGFPSGVFLLLFVVGMCLMGVFAKKLDSGDVRANWIEQLTNTAAQACLLLALLTI